MEQRATPPAEIHNHIAAPTINNQIHEREQPAPVVNVTNQVTEREQAAPVVNVSVEAIMPEQAAPIVNTTVEAVMPDELRMAITEMPDRVTTSTVVRDQDGAIKETIQIEKDLG
jgi:nicotinate-nucleotide pyrophosphorylase